MYIYNTLIHTRARSGTGDGGGGGGGRHVRIHRGLIYRDRTYEGTYVYSGRRC